MTEPLRFGHEPLPTPHWRDVAARATLPPFVTASPRAAYVFVTITPARMRVLASPALINRWLNPYNWLLSTHLAREGVSVHGATPWRLLRGDADIWHVHWPDHVFNQRSATRARLGSRAFLQLVQAARRRGTRIVWTVHNLRAHDGLHRALETAFWGEFIPAVDGLIHLTNVGRTAALERFPELSDRPNWVIPHGHYRTEYVTTCSRDVARRQFDVAATAPLVLFAGRVRPYKNVPALLHAFRDLDDPAARCLVVGKPTDARLRTSITQMCLTDERVKLDLRHLRRPELAAALHASDLVVLPYREILNSGSALLALSLNRPTLVPRRGALAELAEAVGPTWMRCYDGELTGRMLADALHWARESPRSDCAPLEAFEWPAIARAHRDAYATLATGVSGTSATSRRGLATTAVA